MPKPRFVAGVFSLSLMVLGANVVFAQDYPNRIIRVVTAAAGGGSDFIARIIAQGISAPLGQPVIVDNRGSGIIAAEFLSKSPPDGYGLVLTGSSFWIRTLLQKSPYDVARDFSPISLIVREVNVFAVHPLVPVKNIRELIALAKSRPGELNYGTAGVGSPQHISVELFKAMAGVNIVNVPYKSTTAGITALITGEVQITIIDAGLVAPHLKSGRLKALAVTSAAPSPVAPGLPTVAASGLPGYESVNMTGMWAPLKTPVEIINRLNQELVRFLNRSDVKERFLNADLEVVGSSPEQFAAAIKSDTAKWGKVIKDVGIKIE